MILKGSNEAVSRIDTRPRGGSGRRFWALAPSGERRWGERAPCLHHCGGEQRATLHAAVSPTRLPASSPRRLPSPTTNYATRPAPQRAWCLPPGGPPALNSRAQRTIRPRWRSSPCDAAELPVRGHREGGRQQQGWLVRAGEDGHVDGCGRAQPTPLTVTVWSTAAAQWRVRRAMAATSTTRPRRPARNTTAEGGEKATHHERPH